MPTQISAELTQAYHMDEAACVQSLQKALNFTPTIEAQIAELAKKLVEQVRQQEIEKTGVEALMQHYDLSSEEGVLLMCLAEALLRVPDEATEKLLIQDKLTSSNWQTQVSKSESVFVSSMSWGLALTGKILDTQHNSGYFQSVWHGLVRRTSEPLIRQAVRKAIAVLSEQFVLGKNIKEAFKRGRALAEQGYRFSYDMLGEAARTQLDADQYFTAYQQAIIAIGDKHQEAFVFYAPSISVKLSALHPRYEFQQAARILPELIVRMKQLALSARASRIGLTIDAEETDRLELSLTIYEALINMPELADWEGLGLAVQAYQKRAYPLLKWLITLARKHKRRIPIRLVKGAYWDSEIKQAQMQGYAEYPVFTRKAATDVSYLACARLLLDSLDAVYPKFATHNAYSVAAIVSMAGSEQHDQFEFQQLQGMGKSLHQQVIDKAGLNIACRIYAPVGKHEDLLPYLLRRLLENGANSSFVHQIADADIPIEKIIRSPVKFMQEVTSIANPLIPLPPAIYGKQRRNSSGLDFSDFSAWTQLTEKMQPYLTKTWQATALQQELYADVEQIPINNPSNLQQRIGVVQYATAELVDRALTQAEQAFSTWMRLSVDQRAAILEKLADLLEEHRPLLMALIVREAGRVLTDALSEVREAVDFCRYYAVQARQLMAKRTLFGYTGESNTLSLHGRGTFVCISPWNFPVAIFIGQITAALVTGNCVIAKPAEQTSLIAAQLVALCHQAGVPTGVLQLLPGRGETVGQRLCEDERVQGVVFTGSTETAKSIQRSLAKRQGPIIPFIAETGGINAMIVDSTALPEQLINDVLLSAFSSAGQRCSALRVLFLQEDIADKVITMLRGAMEQLVVGDPMVLSTDVGPVINSDAQQQLIAYSKMLQRQATLIYQVECDQATQQGHFVAPQAYLIDDLSLIQREVFGPILHVVRYQQKQLDKMIAVINQWGYGLTFGIHSRIRATVDHICSRIQAGNIYVNRNMIGAVVGLQPFGGDRLSGTGPKAGGPHYLTRFCAETTVTINTAAVGGNTSLMVLADD